MGRREQLPWRLSPQYPFCLSIRQQVGRIRLPAHELTYHEIPVELRDLATNVGLQLRDIELVPRVDLLYPCPNLRSHSRIPENLNEPVRLAVLDHPPQAIFPFDFRRSH